MNAEERPRPRSGASCRRWHCIAFGPRGVLAGEPYTQIWRRAQRTTAVLWTAAAVLLVAVARRLLIA